MSDNVKVTVRVRPFIKREVGDATPASHWDIQDGHTLLQVHPSSRKPLGAAYMFDGVFSPEAQNNNVYQEVAMPIVESALSGFNGTIFVYGQTSSGKTFTMMGDRNNLGIVPLAIQNVFRFIEHTPDREYLIRASYMEIYNENISDLLGRETKGRSLSIREDASGAVYVADLKEEYANCEKQLLSIVKRGEKNRHIASTNMNERSSRSHTIFRLILESRERCDEEGGEGAVTVSHLNLVDLAGSENASQSGATGERLREGGFINKSLFMLGRVISQLSEGEPYVNFRDSKLTRILQLSLGGNSKTAIICTVTPAAVEQTHSTLRFASRAKAIKNQPIVNEVVSDEALLKRYAREIKGLQHTLALERNTDRAQEVEQVREMLGEQARRNEELEAKIHELKTKLVVSTLPRGGCSRQAVDKKRKARRETWCAPAMRTSRISLGSNLLPTLPSSVQEHQFVQPSLPPWAETSVCSNDSVSVSDTSTINIDYSLSHEELGKDDLSFVLNQADKTEFEEASLFPFSPCLVNTKRRKKRRVQFDVAPSPPLASEAGCQTDESLAPHIRLPSTIHGTPQGTPLSTQLPGTPGTPSHVLRARNQELREKLREKEEWLNEWQKEMESLGEFQRLEIKTLEESFERRVGAPSNERPQPQPQESTVHKAEYIQENMSLKKSLQDYEQLLIDANKELSNNVQNSAHLQTRLEALTEENIHLALLQQEVVKLRQENMMLTKDVEVKDCQLKQCENERTDFDMMMELALNKQKQKEEYLQRNLEEAWKDLGVYEKGDVEEVKGVRERLVELEMMKLPVTPTTTHSTTQTSEELPHNVVKAHQEPHEGSAQVLELSEQVEKLTKDKEQLMEEVKDLQEYLSKVLSEQGADRIQTLKEEVQDLKERLEKAEKSQQEKVEEEECLSSPEALCERRGGEGNTLSSQDLSRVLSETIQALEESICVASTPGRRSFSSYIDGLSLNDLEAARPLVETLMAGLTALQEHIQVMEHQQEEATHMTQHYTQMTAQMEKELNTWKIQESFIGDYILHTTSLWRPQHHTNHTFTPTQMNAQETGTHLKAEYEPKLEQLPPFETRRHLSTTNTESLYFSFSNENNSTPDLPGTNEKHKDTISETSFLSFASRTHAMEMEELRGQLELLAQEKNELLDQVRALQYPGNPAAVSVMERETKTPIDTCSSENMCDVSVGVQESGTTKHNIYKAASETMSCEEFEDLQVPKDQELLTTPLEKCTSGTLCWEEHEESDAVRPSLKQPSPPPQSLADELQQVGMNLTMLNDTFETSVVMPMNATTPSSDIMELRQKLFVLEQEKVQLQEMVQDLQDTLKQIKEKERLFDSEQCTEEKIVSIDQLEREREVQRLKEECQNQATYVTKLQDELNSKNSIVKVEVLESEDVNLEKILRLESKVKELEEKHCCKNIVKEEEENTEISSVRLQIEKMEEEKLSLEAKLVNLQKEVSCMNLLEEEMHCLQWQVTTLKDDKSDLEKELLFMQDEVENLTQQNEKPSIENHGEGLVEVLKCEEIKPREISVIPSPKPDDNDSEDASELHQNAKELEEAKEEIRILKQEIEKMHTVSKEMCAEIRNEDNTSKVEENIMDLPESKTKFEFLKEIEKISANYQDELAEKESELEMVITNFMVKEEAFEKTEEDLKRVLTELEEVKETLAGKDLELQGLRNEYNEKLDTLTGELEEMRIVVSNTNKKLQNLQDEGKEEYVKVTTELEELKETLVNKDKELHSVTSKLEKIKGEADSMAYNHTFSNLEEKLHQLQQTYADLQVQSENKLVEAETTVRELKEKYDGCFQDYTAAAQTCEQNRLMLMKSEEENKILKMKLDNEAKKYEEENLNEKQKYDSELQLEKNLKLKYEEENENMKMKYEFELQKHEEEKENLKLKYENELSAIAAKDSQSRETLGLTVQSAVEQKLDKMEILKDDLEEKVKECGQLRDTVENLKAVLTKKQEELHKLSAEHQDELVFYMDTLNEKDKILKNLENETKRTNEKVASLTSALSAKDHCLHRLEKDLSTTQQELRDKETELQVVLSNAQAEDSRRFLELQDDMDQLRKDYDEVCDDRRRMSQAMKILEEAKETLTQECYSLKAQLDNLQENILQIKKELQVGKNNIELKQEIICTLEDEQENLKQEIDRLRVKETELIHQQVTSSHQVEELFENIEKYKCEMSEKEQRIIAMNEDLASRTENVGKLLKDLQDVHDQLKIKCREQEEAERRCEVLKRELEGYKVEAETQIEELMTKLSVAEDKILTNEEKFRDLVNKLQHVQRENEAQQELQKHQPVGDQKTEMLKSKMCELEEELSHKPNHGNSGTINDNGNNANTPLCEDCSHYKLLVERLNTLVKEKETEHTRVVAELSIHHNTSGNASSLSNTLTNTSTQETRRSRREKLEQQNERQLVQLFSYGIKIKELEETLENLRRTNGVISEDAEMQKELNWMWEKMEETEKKLKLLNRNYDILECETEELRMFQNQHTEGKNMKETTENVVILELQAKCTTLEERHEAIEQKYSWLQEEYKILQENFKSVENNVHLQEKCDSLKDNSDTLQKELNTLQEKYSTLQETYSTLQETHRTLQDVHSTVQETHNTLQEKYSGARDEFVTLHEKYNTLLKTYNNSRETSHNTKQVEKSNPSSEQTPVGVMVTPNAEAGDLRERLAAAGRENNELKFRLKALDAPSKKLVESLTEELRIADRKVSHLKTELRRQQEIGRGDSTIYELTGQSSSSSQQQQEGKVRSEPDYSSGSSAVAQIVVMELENKLYHLEKSKKKVENEVKVVQQHVDHYQAKAREWKEKALKEEQAGNKVREEQNQLYGELREYVAKAEELSTKVERQQFELGQQREIIQRMEERQVGDYRPPSASLATPVSPLHSSAEAIEIPPPQESESWAGRGIRREERGTVLTPAITTTTRGIEIEKTAAAAAGRGLGTGTGGNLKTTAATEVVETAEGKDKQKPEDRQTSRYLSTRNFLLSSHTRVEKLPFINAIQDKRTEGEVPMWKSRKENQDLSKYKLPQEERRKQKEDCQTQ